MPLQVKVPPKVITVGKMLKVLRKLPTNVPLILVDQHGNGEVDLTTMVIMRDDKQNPETLYLSGKFVWTDEGDEGDEIDDEEGIPYGAVLETLHGALDEKDKETVLPVEPDCVNYEHNPFLQPA